MSQYFGKNHHENVSRGNYKLMDQLQTIHWIMISRENPDPDILDMKNFFEPFHINWDDAYTEWRVANNASIGKTAEMNVFFDTLTFEKMPRWENKIYGVYPENSSRAKELLPKKRHPFISGPQNERLNALEILISLIGDDANLAALKTDITSFYDTILECWRENQGIKLNVALLSQDLEPLRIATAQAMLANEGALLKKFYTLPVLVDSYFDVHRMRRRVKKKADDNGYNVSLEPAEIKSLPLRFKGTETWSVTNEADHDACLFFCDQADMNAVPIFEKHLLKPGESQEIDLSTLTTLQRFAYAANLSPDNEGEISIAQILKKKQRGKKNQAK